MTRICDLFFSVFGLLVLSPVMILIYFASFFDTGLPIFSQERVGLNKKCFILRKFRTMPPNTPSLATHLVSASSVTKFGYFLRKYKLDELPQLYNVLKGDMSLVGPRPCLSSQFELIRERNARGVFLVKPGITGLAQISNVDMSNPKLLAEIDAEMIRNTSIFSYFRYICLTILGKGFGDRVKELK